jgi:hypothetical protein
MPLMLYLQRKYVNKKIAFTLHLESFLINGTIKEKGILGRRDKIWKSSFDA